MEAIQWNDRYAVQIAEIDEQHKKLFNILNRLADAMSVGKGPDALGVVLMELIDYSMYHFSTEERLFKQYAYSAYEPHKNEHEACTTKIKELKESFDKGNWMLTIDVLKFLTAWLNDHILKEDKKYGSFLNGKGVH
jgi:hemerythrin